MLEGIKGHHGSQTWVKLISVLSTFTQAKWRSNYMLFCVVRDGTKEATTQGQQGET